MKINNEYPKDVQSIIEYTSLRKKYSRYDAELRKRFCFGNNEILLSQMFKLLRLLKEKENELKCQS